VTVTRGRFCLARARGRLPADLPFSLAVDPPQLTPTSTADYSTNERPWSSSATRSPWLNRHRRALPTVIPTFGRLNRGQNCVPVSSNTLAPSDVGAKNCPEGDLAVNLLLGRAEANTAGADKCEASWPTAMGIAAWRDRPATTEIETSREVVPVRLFRSACLDTAPDMGAGLGLEDQPAGATAARGPGRTVLPVPPNRPVPRTRNSTAVGSSWMETEYGFSGVGPLQEGSPSRKAAPAARPGKRWKRGHRGKTPGFELDGDDPLRPGFACALPISSLDARAARIGVPPRLYRPHVCGQDECTADVRVPQLPAPRCARHDARPAYLHRPALPARSPSAATESARQIPCGGCWNAESAEPNARIPRWRSPRAK